MTSPAVHVDRVVKRFEEVTALDGISFDVAPGELFGFIGPDGAGKTTLFRILVTLLVPESGGATVLGEDVVRDMWSLRRRIGYMPGRFSLYPDLSVEENLRFFASVFGTTLEKEKARIAPIYTQIEPFRTRRAGALSGGMKQKLALCCALVHRPEILFLDEPTTGVDAVSRREFWDLLDSMKAELTIVVSTPYMDEASRCDRVALIQGGRILAIDAPAAITASFDRALLAVSTGDRYRALQLLRDRGETANAYPFGETIHVAARGPSGAERLASELEQYLNGHGLEDAKVVVAKPTIEDLFIARMSEAAAAESVA